MTQNNSGMNKGSVFLKPPELDFIVRVDRSKRPTNYPADMEKLMHPELECSGPPVYDLRSVEEWLHFRQREPRGSIRGKKIYQYLKANNAFSFCLNMQDGLAIQQMGVDVLRCQFSERCITLWASTLECRTGGLFVPFLFDDALKGKVGVIWSSLNDFWDTNCPTVFHSK